MNENTMINGLQKNARWIFLICLLMVVKVIFAQKFSLPPIPDYDSVYVDAYKGKVKKKIYYSDGVRVFMIGYNTGSMLYAPFYAMSGSKEDSCYAYYNGANHDQYDFYYFSDDYIINDKYAENNKLFKHQKITRDNVLMEKGDYYFIKTMSENTISHCEKYKIGEWVKCDSAGGPMETINYDDCTLNGEPIRFTGNLEKMDSLKSLADKKIIDVYGKKFFSKYVRFNLDQSGYYTRKCSRPEQPGGKSLLTPSDKYLYSADLSYDIVIGQDRFNIIQFRVNYWGEFLGKTYFHRFSDKAFYLTRGLDSLNVRKFHKNVTNWKKVALANGFDITSRGFNMKFAFYPTGDSYGDLRLVLEQVIDSESAKNSFTNKLKRLSINPWTGELEKSEGKEGSWSVSIE